MKHSRIFYGCFDGTHGHEIAMTMEQARSASHQGQCDDDVLALSRVPAIAKQLDTFTPEQLASACRESGAWEESELQNHGQNRQRVLWFAAGDIVENLG